MAHVPLGEASNRTQVKSRPQTQWRSTSPTEPRIGDIRVVRPRHLASELGLIDGASTAARVALDV
jgi:hypothetical protein